MNENHNHGHPEENRPETPEEKSRRRFFRDVSIIVGGCTALGFAAPTIGFILGPLTRRPPRVWRTVGKLDAFKIGDTVDVHYEDASPEPWSGVTARTAAWLRRESADKFIAFSVNCTHLGCPVRWLAQARLFMCPCHGGVFYESGDVAAGPPERPLTRYAVRVVNGEVQIETAPVPITTS
ncbi:MAG: (2Fe-2S)-binding protein [Pedosphaera sp.]|nr:(2Fe-2S)-binding protein [Pedosphaera sp.]